MRWSSIPLTPTHLSLVNTLPIGQSFLWHHHAGVYSRAVHDPPRVVFLRQTPTELEYAAVHPDTAATEEDYKQGITKRWVEDYFQLSYDLPKLYSEWRTSDPGLFARTELDQRAIGVRVLRQDPWECLIGFITSTNNHIIRISSLMHKLAKAYSPPLLEIDEVTYHLFPPPHVLPTKLEAELRDLGFGYRARFIESSLETLKEKFGTEEGAIEKGLEAYRTQPLETVRDELVELKGVGRKVADCVMLMSMDKLQAIPVDTHVAAIAARHPAFPSRLKNKPMNKVLYDQVQEFLEDKWGPLGGWCQAVMFSADLRPAKGRVAEKDAGEEVKLEKMETVETKVQDGSVKVETTTQIKTEVVMEEQKPLINNTYVAMDPQVLKSDTKEEKGEKVYIEKVETVVEQDRPRRAKRRRTDA